MKSLLQDVRLIDGKTEMGWLGLVRFEKDLHLAAQVHASGPERTAVSAPALIVPNRYSRSRGRGLARSRVERHDDPELREARGGGGSTAASRDDRAGGWPTRLLSLKRLDRESFQTALLEEKIE